MIIHFSSPTQFFSWGRGGRGGNLLFISKNLTPREGVFVTFLFIFEPHCIAHFNHLWTTGWGLDVASRDLLRKNHSTQSTASRYQVIQIKTLDIHKPFNPHDRIHPVLRSELALPFLVHDTLLILIYPLSKRWSSSWVLLLNHQVFHCKWQPLHFISMVYFLISLYWANIS